MPKIVTLPAGENWVCLCGRSKNDPHCDGSHDGTGKQPKRVVMAEAGTAAVCGCHASANDPFCDGSHDSKA